MNQNMLTEKSLARVVIVKGGTYDVSLLIRAKEKGNDTTSEAPCIVAH